MYKRKFHKQGTVQNELLTSKDGIAKYLAERWNREMLRPDQNESRNFGREWRAEKAPK